MLSENVIKKNLFKICIGFYEAYSFNNEEAVI